MHVDLGYFGNFCVNDYCESDILGSIQRFRQIFSDAGFMILLVKRHAKELLKAQAWIKPLALEK